MRCSIRWHLSSISFKENTDLDADGVGEDTEQGLTAALSLSRATINKCCAKVGNQRCEVVDCLRLCVIGILNALSDKVK